MSQFIHLPDESFNGSIGHRGFGGELNKAISTEQGLIRGKCLDDVSFLSFFLSFFFLSNRLLSVLSLMTPGGIGKAGSFPYMYALSFKQQITKREINHNGRFLNRNLIPSKPDLSSCSKEDQRHAAHWLRGGLVAFDNIPTGTYTLKLSFYLIKYLSFYSSCVFYS